MIELTTPVTSPAGPVNADKDSSAPRSATKSKIPSAMLTVSIVLPTESAQLELLKGTSNMAGGGGGSLRFQAFMTTARHISDSRLSVVPPLRWFRKNCSAISFPHENS